MSYRGSAGWAYTVALVLVSQQLLLTGCSSSDVPSPVVEEGMDKDTISVPGLKEPVEIIIDRWGIPHIYAANDIDLFFAQGFNAARDRLFQVEIWRRRATGTMAELFGPRAVRSDHSARLFSFRGDLQEELRRFSDRGVELFDAFVRGINAYVAHTEAYPELLPIEFRVLDFRPSRWTPEVVISRHNGLFRNAGDEVRNAQLLGKLTPEELTRIKTFLPWDPDLSSNGVDLSLITPDILQLYNAHGGRVPVTFTPEDLSPELAREIGSRAAVAVWPVDSLVAESDAFAKVMDWGSNNWVVGGQRSLSGRPVVAQEPHRRMEIPSVRYTVHLIAPGWNVIGSGEPTVPGVSLGHNDYGAWSLTLLALDQEDLYVYDTHPDSPSLYMYRGQWEEMDVLRDTIRARGAPPSVVDLKYTRHGPVLYEDREHQKAYALRATWLEPGTAPYLGSLRYNLARNWEEFREAATYHLAPPHYMVWADVDGTIGWQGAGMTPNRRNWSGELPVPGDGRFEWDGFIPIDDLPHGSDPSEGFITTNNVYIGFLAPYSKDDPTVLSYKHSEPLRYARVYELLSSSQKYLTIMDHMRVQHDELSIPARNLVPLLQELPSPDRTTREALEMLLSWNYVLDKNSVAAAIYVSWERQLWRRLHEMFVPEDVRELVGRLDFMKMLNWLLSPGGEFGPDPVAERDALLITSLEDAVEDLRSRLGSDMRKWQYGQEKLKHIQLRHALSDVVNEEVRRKLDVGPLPRGGSYYTVNNTGSGDNQPSGPSYRTIVDVGAWDNSVVNFTPGQSGDPDSPHYRDAFELWASGKYFPLAFSRRKVESVASKYLWLIPVGADR